MGGPALLGCLDQPLSLLNELLLVALSQVTCLHLKQRSTHTQLLLDRVKCDCVSYHYNGYAQTMCYTVQTRAVTTTFQ